MATWSMHVDQMEDMTDPDTSGELCIPDDQCIKINCIRTRLAFVGQPSFTNLRMCLDIGDGKFLAESVNSYEPADLYEEDFALKEISFEFCPPLILTPGAKVRVRIKADDYVFVDCEEYVAWVYSDVVPVGGCANQCNILGKQLMVVGCCL